MKLTRLLCQKLASAAGGEVPHQKSSLTAVRYGIGRSDFAQVSDTDLSFFERVLGKSNVITEDLDAVNNDWLGCYQGQSRLLLRPKSGAEIAQVLRHCNERRLAVCPQAGNTGLVGGSVPVHDEIVLSLGRLNQIEHFDELSGVLSCESGCILEQLDNFVGEHGHMMPLDLGAKGSCQIGGNLATAAGGIRLIRYGTLHANTLGMEVVLPDGTILSQMSTLRKDNTGFHLPHLFIGSEGMLGVITRAVITCPPRPRSVNLAFLACDSFANCISVLKSAKLELGEILSSFEFLDQATLRMVVKHLKYDSVLPPNNKFYLLVETSGSDLEHDREKLDRFLKICMDKKFVVDGTLAADSQQTANIWKLRENAAEAMKHVGYVYKQDFSLPIRHFYEVVEIARKIAGDLATEVVGYGHLADGNIHLNLMSPEYDERLAKRLYPFLYEWTAARGGSISAEHGIGFVKRSVIHYNKSPELIEKMRQLKKLFDPNGILNPYKVIPPP